MAFDYERWQQACEYGKLYLDLLLGNVVEPLANYPDASDNSVVQCVYDTLDKETLFNDVLFEQIHDILDKWLVEEISPLETRMQLTELLTDTYGFGC